MAGYNYFPVGYQPYQVSYNPVGYQPQMQMPQMPQQPMQQAQSNANAPMTAQQNPSTIIWVNGERQALEYPVAANGAVALWDSANPVIYLKQADASGKPSTKIFDLVERVEAHNDNQGASGIDMSHFAEKSDVAALAGIVSDVRKDIEAIKDEMGNLASQVVKRAVGAKPKAIKESVPEDDD